MKRDITLLEGDRDKPVVIFIHGLGMDKRIWACPDESRVLGGKFPVDLFVRRKPDPVIRSGSWRGTVTSGLFLGEPLKDLATLFHTMKERGYTVLTWSQQRPSAGIDVAVSELREIVTMTEDHCRAGMILIGHSRGGLVARQYLACGDKRVRCLITLATPHLGSRMAQWAEYVNPLASLVSALLPVSERGTTSYAVRKVLDFLRSTAVKQLLPDSGFFRALNDRRCKGVYYLSFGGKDPTLFSVYRRAITRVRHDDKERVSVQSRRVFSFPDIFEKVIPSRLFPDELKQGRGDGLVSVQSSRLPWADEHHDFDVNHAGILFDERIKGIVATTLDHL
jgi:pimeloyl-ACP methyl ester carboxylesterase